MVRTLDTTKRNAITLAARTIFARDGYDDAKISDIAAEAKVAPGTLYLYFENKEALAAAIGEELFARMTEQFSELVHKLEGPDDVPPLVDWGLRVAAEESDLLSMAKERKKKHDKGNRFLVTLSAALSDCMSRGVIRKYADVNALADMVLAVMRRLLFSCAIYNDDAIENLRDGAVEFLQHALFDDLTLAANKMANRKRSD